MTDQQTTSETQPQTPHSGNGSELSGLVSNDVCAKCGEDKQQATCWNCGGEGRTHHDCGEDTCCCLYPHDNVVCDICDGNGDYMVCPHCYPDSFDDC